ncbi:MAG: hypothetical protein H7A51_04250 [Akkermansiaceae bacterium]|nr:hypothetical protein [Akkermansiaceae bacterium]
MKNGYRTTGWCIQGHEEAALGKKFRLKTSRAGEEEGQRRRPAPDGNFP